MQPQALSRAIQEEFGKVLGDAALRGEPLEAAVATLGSREGIEPFRACLRGLSGIERPEDEARVAFLAIESHRSRLQALMRRDPGFWVAAADYFQEVEGGPRHVRPGESAVAALEVAGPVTAGATPSLDELLLLETRRSERSARPLTVVVLAPDEGPGSAGIDLEAAAMILRDAARAVDHTARILPRGFAVIQPCTPGSEGVHAAGRLRNVMMAATGQPWSAGVAAHPGTACEAPALARGARVALRGARRRGGDAVVLHHGERRSYPRRLAVSRLRATLRAGGRESEVTVEDLSIGGALVGVRERLAPGSDVVLALSEDSARPRQVALPSRVLRADEVPGPGGGTLFRTGVVFTSSGGARHVVAGLLADLAPPDPVVEPGT